MIRFGGVLLVAALAVVLSTAPANATVFINDNFNAHAPGGLVPQGGWAAHSGAGNRPVQVIPGSACYSPPVPGNYIEVIHATASGEDVNLATGVTMDTGDKWYAGFCVVVEAESPLTDDNYFAHFKTSGTYYGAKVYDAPPNVAGNDFTFGFQAAGGGEDASAFWPTDFQYGTCHRIVVSYEFDTGNGEMWVDPICELGPDGNPKLTDTGYDSNTFIAFAFRQDNYGDPDPTQKIDDLLVGTSFAEVCVPCVPEPGTLALLALGGLALLRRR